MKHRPILSTLLFFLIGFGGASACAETATQIDVPLHAPDGFSATKINAIGNDRYCVSGYIYNDEGPSESAFVLLLNANSRQVVWQTSIPYGRDYVGNAAARCISDGNVYYVITEENTNSAESLNQTRLYINKISDKGKLLQRQPIEAGFDEWSYLLDVRPGVISVGGGTSATLNRKGKFSTFLIQFNADLVRMKTVKLDSGAFWVGSNAKLDDEHLLVAGQFLPNTASNTAHDAFAVSKIDMGKSKYVWSNYVPPTDTQQATSIFASDGRIYTAALTATNLAVSIVDRTGKTEKSFLVKKPLCGIQALTLAGNSLRAIGASCKRESSSAIVDIDLTGETTTVAHDFDNDISAPEFDDSVWVGIVNTKTTGKVFRRSAQ